MRIGTRLAHRLFALVTTLALITGPSAFSAGGPGNTLSYPGNGNGWVAVPHNPVLNAYPFTVMFWMFSSQSGSGQSLVSKSETFGNNGWNVVLEFDGIRATYQRDGANYVGSPGGGLFATLPFGGGWRHIAVTIDASGGQLYVDGALRDSRLWTGFSGPPTTMAELLLGPQFGSFNGQLDEISLWNVALTQSQIQGNMRRSLVGNEAGLITYYRCDETMPGTTIDSAPAGGTNNGTWNGNVTLSQSSLFPFSPYSETIGFTGSNGAPVTVFGRVNAAGTNTFAWFEWGTTTDYGNTSPPQLFPGGIAYLTYSHQIPNVVNGVTYHFRSVASNIFGIARGTNQTFGPPLIPATVTTLPATAVSTNAATLNGIGNPQGTPGLAWFVWDVPAGPGVSTVRQPIGSNVTTTNFSVMLTGLSSGVTYRFQAYVSNAAGVVGGTELSFTTASSPFVTTLPASGITATNATLNGQASAANSAAAAWFEWGLTTNYGNVTPVQSIGNGTNMVGFAQTISGLGGATYHYRAVASNGVGTTFGSDGAFNTPAFVMVDSPFPQIYGGGAWGDYDNDGRLDVLLSGSTTNQFITQVWRNTGESFSNIPVGVILSFQNCGWIDYDNNGALDFWLGSSGFAQLWTNTGGSFGPFGTSNSGFAGAGPSVSWADFDNDGRADAIATGNGTTQVRRNTSGGFTLVNTGVSGGSGTASWGDFDNDGWQDFLLVSGTSNTRIWRNQAGTFSQFATAFPSAISGTAAWADYDNDGRLDFAIAGTNNTGLFCQIWRNAPSGFTNINAGLPGVQDGSLAWGDYDNDGRLDLLISGTVSYDTNGYPKTALTQVWRNTATGFTNISAGFPGLGYGTASWGDFDNDGRLDILATGVDTNRNFVTQIWRNRTATGINTLPAPPSGLLVSVSNSIATLSWSAATDAETPTAGLTYNVRIGTTPGGSDVLAPMSSANGLRRVPRRGNAEGRLFAYFVYTVGTPYYWSVQAVDSAMAGSAFATERNFRILQPAPTIVSASVSNLISGDSNGDGVVSQSELDVVLASYFPQAPWLQMTNVAGLGASNVSFTLLNSTAGTFSAEVSTNLFNWNYLGPAVPHYEFIDTNAPGGPQRYYRLRWP